MIQVSPYSEVERDAFICGADTPTSYAVSAMFPSVNFFLCVDCDTSKQGRVFGNLKIHTLSHVRNFFGEKGGCFIDSLNHGKENRQEIPAGYRDLCLREMLEPTTHMTRGSD